MRKPIRTRLLMLPLLALLVQACSENTPVGMVDNLHVDGTMNKSASYFLVEYGGAPSALAGHVQALGGTVDRVYAPIGVARVSGLDEQQAQVLASRPGVQYVTRDVHVKWVPSLVAAPGTTTIQYTGPAQTQNHRGLPHFWSRQWPLQVMEAQSAWAISTGVEVRVGILDTGISPDHIDLVGKYDLGKSINMSSSNAGNPNDYIDRNSHGTHVSGIVSSNGIAIAGVAPGATLVGVKVLDDNGEGGFDQIINGIIYATDVADCDIINMSLGGYGPRAHYGRFIAMITRAVNYANSRGVLVVSAAGNDAIDLDHNGQYVVLPAQSGQGMCISATGPIARATPDAFACYSNFGRSAISVAAPGGNINCETGAPAHPNDLVISCLAPAVAASLGLPDPTEWYMSTAGTSMAAPHVAGVAALVQSAKGNSNPGYLRTRIESSADDLGAPGVDPYYGKGRVNALNAVQ